MEVSSAVRPQTQKAEAFTPPLLATTATPTALLHLALPRLAGFLPCLALALPCRALPCRATSTLHLSQPMVDTALPDLSPPG